MSCCWDFAHSTSWLNIVSLNQDIFLFKWTGGQQQVGCLSALRSLTVHPSIKRGKHHPLCFPALGVRTFTVTLTFRFSVLPPPNVTSWLPDKRLNFQRRVQIISNLLQSQHLCQFHHLFNLHITLSVAGHSPLLHFRHSWKVFD